MQDVDTNILALDGGGSSSCRDFCLEHVEQCSSCTENGNLPTYESSLRKSYCIFLQKLGRQLKLPQVTIATAIIFCHRFFLRQSLARNDRYIIATVCMFLAGKVEETPEGLQNVIVASYELRNAKDADALSKIKQKEVYDEQKELLLLGERLVLITLGFNLNVAHPYKPLISAIKRLSLPPTVSRSQLAQIAWNFVNDGLQTLLCVQFKPYHVAAGALFLTAKFLRIKIFDWEEILSREFDISLQQLEDVSNQILQSYEPLKDVSANGSRGSKLIRVYVATSCRNQASTDSAVDLNMISPLSIHEGDTKWPSSPGRATMEEEMRTIMLQKTQESKAASFDLESGTCHTGQSDLTDENETRVLGGSYYLEEDYLESEKGRSCEEFDNSCGSLTPSGSDEHSTHRPCLSGWEMELRRDNRDTSPDIETKDGAVVEVRRHNPCDRVSSRHRGIRQVFNRSLFDRRKDPRKAVTRGEFLLQVRNKRTQGRRDLTDYKNRHLQNRLKLLRQKDEILKTHCSWGTREHDVKYSG